MTPTLIERIESATGADRGLDDAIAEAIFTGKHRTCIKGLSDEAGGMWMFTYPDGSIGSSLRFTASVDAALTLVPEHTHFSLITDGAVRFIASVSGFIDGANTPALAICAAALKARNLP